MDLKDKIRVDFIASMKNREKERKTLLSVVLGEIQNEESRNGNINDEMVLGILKKMEKSLKQINTEESLLELTYIESYLPKLMSEKEIRDIIEGFKTEGITDIGRMMGSFNKENKGKADNGLVSKIVKEVLA